MTNYNQAIEFNSKDANVYKGRGDVKALSGDFDGAIADYEQAIQLDPKHAHAKQLNANHAHAYSSRGHAYYQQENYEKAINDYNEAIRLTPNFANAYRNRANAFKKQGENEKADADFVKAAEVESSR